MEKKIVENVSDYEPKRQNRFIVEFQGIDIPLFVINKIDLPKYSNGKWKNIEIDCVDLIVISSSQLIYDVLKSQKKRSLFKKPIFSFTIDTLDPTGNSVEKWKIQVERITYVDFGYYSYENNDAKNVIMVVKPLSCKLI